jgi:hypothetical protein
MDRFARRRRLAVVLCALLVSAVAAGLGVVSVHAASGKRQGCRYGVSSIGPVIIADGVVVGGSTVPQTEDCLP